MYLEIYQDLKRGFQQSWLGFLFKHSALGRLLVQENTPSQSDFFNAYCSSWWWNRIWFRACIQNPLYRYRLDDMVACLAILKKSEIFSEINCNKVTDHADPHLLIYGLLLLNGGGVLNDATLAVVADHAKPDRLAQALFALDTAGILNVANTALVAAHGNLKDLVEAFFVLDAAGILSQPIFDFVATYTKSLAHLRSAFSCLHNQELLNDTNIALFAMAAYPRDLHSALSGLARGNILTQTNLNLVITNPNPSALILATAVLARDNILTQPIFDVTAAHAHPVHLRVALSKMKEHNILTDMNLARLAADPFPGGLACDLVNAHVYHRDLAIALASLKKAGLLNDENRALVSFEPKTTRLTIPSTFMNENRNELSFLIRYDLILIMTTKAEEYRRILTLIPDNIRDRIISLDLYTKIKMEQEAVLNCVDIFSLAALRLSSDLIYLIQQYEGHLNEWINQAVPLPFQETELLQYSKHLKKFVKQYEQEQQRIALEDKLNQVVVRAQDAIAKRNPRFFQAESNKSQLEKRRAQIEATITLISWLSDDTATLTQKELALLGQQESVKLILEKNPIQCPKIAWLKTQLEATSAYQAALYNQERRSLSDQKFLLGLEKNSLWANRQVSPQAHHAFDSRYGLILAS